MATKLDKYESRNKPGPDPIYPWDEWLDGRSIWLIIKEEDFPDSSVGSMEDHIRKTARSREIKVSVFREGENGLVIKPRKR